MFFKNRELVSAAGDCSRHTNLFSNSQLELAVRVGFEPTEPAKVQRFSRPPDSTALAPHRHLQSSGFTGLKQLSAHRPASSSATPTSTTSPSLDAPHGRGRAPRGSRY